MSGDGYGLPGLDPGLALLEFVENLPSAPQPVDHLKQSDGLGPRYRIRVELSLFSRRRHEVDEPLTTGHSRRDFQATDVLGPRVILTAHHSLLTSARAVTRHVTGALLAARRWLQRKAWTRRAAAPTRPSGTTTEADT